MRTLKSWLRRRLVGLHLEALIDWWHRFARLDPRLLWREARFRRWRRGSGPEDFTVRPGLRLRIDPRSREPFEWFCFRSLEMSRELDAFAREMALRRNFLDVGACHGIFTMAFTHHRPDVKALAIEPSGVAFSILVENLRLNGLDNAVPLEVACGSTAGRLRMRQVWHHLEALSKTDRSADDVEVSMQSVDDLCAELAFAPDLIKIDVEGYELAVLSGALATLNRYRPRLFLELHPERLLELGGSTADVVRLLTGIGYGFVDLGGSPISARRIADRRSVSRVMCAMG